MGASSGNALPEKKEGRGKRYYDMLPLISDAVVGAERETIVSDVLRSGFASSLRGILARDNKHISTKAPEQIAGSISQSMQVQLLMSLKDGDLVRFIDRCILTERIKIPLAELRAAKSLPPALSSYDEPSQISALGIRVEQDHPALYLSTLIWKAYEDKQQLSELAWRTQKGNNISQAQIPLEFMKKNDPRAVVQRLILSSGSITSWVADALNVDLALCDSEDKVIDSLLWRCGFNPPRYDAKYARMKNQLEQFRTELLRYRGKLNENDRDSIRSKGVNVFVSLENLLEEIVSYTIWVLSSDHFLVTKSCYGQAFALNRVADVIGEEGRKVSWRRQGGNVLGTLLLYARATSRWIGTLEGKDRSCCLRSPADLPHFIKDEVHKFPFYHTELWADTDPLRLRDYASAYSDLIGQFEMSKLAEVRNGLDHFREEDRFPSLETMVFCQAKLSDAREYADINRFVPKMFWLDRYTVDAFGRSESVLKDYRGQKIEISGPEPIIGNSPISFSVPFLVPFGNLIGYPNSEIIFRIRNETEYSKFWAGYPRRLNVSAPVDDETVMKKEVVN